MNVRFNDKNEMHIEYDIIFDYEPIFGDDPLKPEAIVYPIATKDTVLEAVKSKNRMNKFYYAKKIEEFRGLHIKGGRR